MNGDPRHYGYRPRDGDLVRNRYMPSTRVDDILGSTYNKYSTGLKDVNVKREKIPDLTYKDNKYTKDYLESKPSNRFTTDFDKLTRGYDTTKGFDKSTNLNKFTTGFDTTDFKPTNFKSTNFKPTNFNNPLNKFTGNFNKSRTPSNALDSLHRIDPLANADHNKYLRSPIRRVNQDIGSRFQPEKLYRNRLKVTKSQNKPGFMARLLKILGRFSLDRLESDFTNVDTLKESLVGKPKKVSFNLEKEPILRKESDFERKEPNEFDFDDDPVDRAIRQRSTNPSVRSTDMGNGRTKDRIDDLIHLNTAYLDRTYLRDHGVYSQDYRNENDLQNYLNGTYQDYDVNRAYLKNHGLSIYDLTYSYGNRNPLEDELRSTQTQMERFEAENLRLSAELEACERQLRELRSKNVDLVNNSRKVEQEYETRLDAARAELGTKIGELLRYKAELADKVTEFIAERRSTESQIASLEADKRDLERQKDELALTLQQIRRDYNETKQELRFVTHKLREANNSVGEMKQQVNENAGLLRRERNRADQLQMELEYKLRELREKTKELEQAGIASKLREKLSAIKERHERERVKLILKRLQLDARIEKFEEEHNRLRRSVNYQIPGFKENRKDTGVIGDDASKEDVYLRIEATIEDEIEMLRRHNYEGRVRELKNSATFFRKLAEQLEESQRKKEAKVQELSEMLLDQFEPGDSLDFGQMNALYVRKYGHLVKMRRINELMMRLNVLFEYEEDAGVVGRQHEVYRKVKAEIEGEYL